MIRNKITKHHYYYLSCSLGLFINAGIIPSFKLDSHQRMKTFMGEIVILYETHVLKVTPNKILYDGAELFWSDGQPYNFNDLVIEIVTIRGCRVIRVDFGNNVQITIKRTIASVNMAVDYLNLYIENEAGLSNSSDGILGKFSVKNCYCCMFPISILHLLPYIRPMIILSSTTL